MINYTEHCNEYYSDDDSEDYYNDNRDFEGTREYIRNLIAELEMKKIASEYKNR